MFGCCRRRRHHHHHHHHQPQDDGDDDDESSSLSSCIKMTDRLAQSIFLLLGVGVLVPWNAFISAVPYFQLRLCSLPNASQHFESWVGFLFNLSSVIALILLMTWPWWLWNQQEQEQQQSQEEPFVSLMEITESNNHHNNTESIIITTTTTTNQHQQDEEENAATNATTSNKNPRHSFWLVTLPFLLYLVVFFVTDLLVIPMPTTPTLFLALTLLSMMICGACAAIGGAGVVAFAGQNYPNPHLGINPFVAGQAVGGVAVSAANFMSAMAEDPNLYWQQHCHNNKNNDSTTATTTTSIIQQQVQWGSSNSSVTSLTQYDLYYNPNNENQSTTSTTCPPYESMDRAVFLYFFVGGIVLLCCVIGFQLLDHSTSTRQQPTMASSPSASSLQRLSQQEEDCDDEHHRHDDGNNSNATETFQDEAPSPRSGLEMPESHHQHTSLPTETNTMMIDRQPSYHEAEVVVIAATTTNNQNGDGLFRRLPSNPSNENLASSGVDDETTTSSTRSIFYAVKGPACCIFLTFFVTLALFPSWTSTLRSIHECTPGSYRINNDLYTPMTFLLFNLGDLGGRLVAGIMPTTTRIRNFSTKLVLASCLRCLFFPLLLICVGGSSNDNDDIHNQDTMATLDQQQQHMMQIESDAYSILIQSLFALSNGWLISLAFMHAPTLIPTTPTSQEKSSEILTLSLSTGLMCGSLFSFVVTKFAIIA